MEPSGSTASPKPSENDEHPHSMMTSTEVDLLVHSYLVESATRQRPRTVWEAGWLIQKQRKLRKSIVVTLGTPLADAERNALREELMRHNIPPGHLVRILQKGLLYLEAEAKYRGDPSEPPPRLIGYTIPNSLPLPPLPKEQPYDRNPPTPGPSATESVKQPSLPPPAPAPAPAQATTSASTKEKGKGKDSNETKKRKGRASVDKDNEAKRARTASTEVKNRNKKATPTPTSAATEDEESRTDATPAETTPAPETAPTSLETKDETKPASKERTLSPVDQVRRSISPAVSRQKDGSLAPETDVSVPSKTSALNSARIPTPVPQTNGNRSKTTSPAMNSVPLPEPEAQPATTDNKTVEAEEDATADAETDKASTPAGLLQVKAEEAEQHSLPTPDEDAEMKDASAEKEEAPTFDMTGVVQLRSGDNNVTILRGHTVPKVQGISWNTKVPNLLATGGGDSTCRIWDVTVPVDANANTIVTENLFCKHSSGQRKCDVAAVAWNPAGSLLATGSEDGIARVWTPAGDLHLVLSMHQRTIFSLKWNSLGTQILTGSLDGTVCLWDLNSGKVKQQWSTHADSVLDVDWNDDEIFASGSMDKCVHLFNVARMPPMHRFKGHRDEVNVVRFSPCRTLLASCSDDGTVRIWSLKNIVPASSTVQYPAESRLIDDGEHNGVLVLEGHEADVHTLTWAPWKPEENQPKLLASASFDHSVRLWDADTGECLHKFVRHTDFVYSLAFGPSPEERDALATASNDGRLCIWRLSDRQLIQEFEHSGPLYELAWHPSGSAICVTGRTEDVAVVGVQAK